VRYGEYRAILAIDSLAVLSGELPPRVRGLLTEWATLHRSELEDDWQRARDRRELRAIPPLE
jgi:hypothetical protein